MKEDLMVNDALFLDKIAAKALRLWENANALKAPVFRPRRRVVRAAFDVNVARSPESLKDLDELVKKIVHREKPPSFVDLVRKYVRERCDGKASLAYKAAGVSRQAYSAMISKADRMVEKRTAVAFALAFGLDWKEAKTLIKSAGWSLATSIKEDAVYHLCFTSGVRSIHKVNYILDKCGCRPLTVN